MNNFLQVLPPVTDPRGIQHIESYSPVNPHMVPIHFCYHASTIVLYNMIIEHDNQAYRKVVDAAHAMASLSRALHIFGPISAAQACAQTVPFVYCGAKSSSAKYAEPKVERQRNRYMRTLLRNRVLMLFLVCYWI